MPKYPPPSAPARSTSRTLRRQHDQPSPSIRAKAKAKPDPSPLPPPQSPRFLLSIEDVARELYMTPAGVYKLLARGELAGSIKVGRRRLWPIKAIEAYIAERIAAAEDAGGAA